ncbi:MAG: hypothetical protein AB2600_19605, partial [Candidatus Thiodiazotropha sp.]
MNANEREYFFTSGILRSGSQLLGTEASGSLLSQQRHGRRGSPSSAGMRCRGGGERRSPDAGGDGDTMSTEFAIKLFIT